MAECPHCATSLPEDAPACQNCGRLVASGQKLSVGAGVLLGCAITVGALVIWAIGGTMMLGHEQLCLWYRAYHVATLVLCIGAITVGVRMARRGTAGVAVAILVPAVVLLAPTTACTVSAFAMRC